MAVTTTETTTTTRRSNASKMLGLAAFLMMVASLFYWLSTFSVPYAKSIYYVRTRENGVKYGNFGWCANDDTLCYRHVGYEWRPQVPGGPRLTGSLILVALTAAFSTLAFFSLLHSMRNLRSGAVSFGLTLFTVLLSTLSFFLVIICFAITHSRLSRDSLRPRYGPALPLVIVAWLLHLATVPLVIIGWLRNRHHYNQTTVRHV